MGVRGGLGPDQCPQAQSRTLRPGTRELGLPWGLPEASAGPVVLTPEWQRRLGHPGAALSVCRHGRWAGCAGPWSP